jgi:hypothetical protein
VNHKWIECDDIVALYLYKFGASRLGISLADASATLDITPSSMKMRLQNFKSIENAGGLPNVAQLSRRVYKQYHTFSEAEMRSLVMDCLKVKQ